MAAGADSDMPLTSATDLNKCYFQRNGELVEVMYNGTQWTALGNVTMS